MFFSGCWYPICVVPHCVNISSKFSLTEFGSLETQGSRQEFRIKFCVLNKDWVCATSRAVGLRRLNIFFTPNSRRQQQKVSYKHKTLTKRYNGSSYMWLRCVKWLVRETHSEPWPSSSCIKHPANHPLSILEHAQTYYPPPHTRTLSLSFSLSFLLSFSLCLPLFLILSAGPW